MAARWGIPRWRAGWWHWRARRHLARSRHDLSVPSAERALTALEANPARDTWVQRVGILHAMSRVYEDLADHDAADRLLLRAMDALADHPDDARYCGLAVQTLTRSGNLARLQGRHEQAERCLRRALAIAADGSGGAVEAIGARNALAITYKDAGRYVEAAVLYRQVLAEVVARFGAYSTAAATSFHNLAGLAHARGDFSAAEPLARRAVQLRTRVVGAHHPAVAADLVVLAAVLLGAGHLDQAERAYRRALRIYTRVFGSGHYEIAVVLNGLAGIEVERGHPWTAEPLYQRALAIKQRVLGPEHPEIGVLLNNLAVVHRHVGQLAAAACYHRALPLLRRSLGDQHPTVRVCTDNLAGLTEQAERPP